MKNLRPIREETSSIVRLDVEGLMEAAEVK